jgi:hypothetical protein
MPVLSAKMRTNGFFSLFRQFSPLPSPSYPSSPPQKIFTYFFLALLQARSSSPPKNIHLFFPSPFSKPALPRRPKKYLPIFSP